MLENETINTTIQYIKPVILDNTTSAISANQDKVILTVKNIALKSNGFLESIGHTISPDYSVLAAVLFVLFIIWFFAWRNS